jgi:hypothetical protein
MATKISWEIRESASGSSDVFDLWKTEENEETGEASQRIAQQGVSASYLSMQIAASEDQLEKLEAEASALRGSIVLLEQLRDQVRARRAA